MDIDAIRVKIDEMGHGLYDAIMEVNRANYPRTVWGRRNVHLLRSMRSLVKLAIDLAEEVERLHGNARDRSIERSISS